MNNRIMIVTKVMQVVAQSYLHVFFVSTQTS
jgi:hypothetical protein